MFYQGQTNNTCGCNQGSCPQTLPTYQQCNQVIHVCNVEEIPHYIDFHTHVVNDCVKKHINVPTYSTSMENVLINEYPQAQGAMPYMPYQPIYGNQMFGNVDQYQGNVGVNPSPSQMSNPYVMGQYQGMGTSCGY